MRRSSAPSWHSLSAAGPALLFTAVALTDFDGAEPEDLSFKMGDLIAVTEDVDQNWYSGELRGRTGIFPKEFVRRN